MLGVFQHDVQQRAERMREALTQGGSNREDLIAPWNCGRCDACQKPRPD